MYIDIEVDQKKLLLPYDLNINDVMAILNLKCRGFQPLVQLMFKFLK